MCIFPCYISKNAIKWFKVLRLGSIASFEQLRYLLLNNFMQLRKGNGDTNSIVSCKQKEGDSIRAYSDRFMLAALNVPVHKEFLVIGAFVQGLLLELLSKNMYGTVPQLREEIKYRVEKYLWQIEGEERKETNLKVVANVYIK